MLTQEQLAVALGVTRSSISNIEKGRHRIFLDQAYVISRTLRVALSDLLPHESEVFDSTAVSVSPALEGSANTEELQALAMHIRSKRSEGLR